MRYVLPVLAQAAGRLAAEIAGVQFLAPVSDPAYEETVRSAFGRSGARVTVLQGMEYDALQLAGAAAVCSGTATLEFACLGVPMVIVYRASAGTSAQYALVRGLLGGQRRAGMPNIIAGRDIVPELLGRRATPAAVALELGSLLRDEERRARMKTDLAEVAASLGGPGASERTADLVLELMGQEKAVGAGDG
jgi:lipid-A-disaccharide synthase